MWLFLPLFCPFCCPHSFDCAGPLLLCHSRALLVNSALFLQFTALIVPFCRSAHRTKCALFRWHPALLKTWTEHCSYCRYILDMSTRKNVNAIKTGENVKKGPHETYPLVFLFNTFLGSFDDWISALEYAIFRPVYRQSRALWKLTRPNLGPL